MTLLRQPFPHLLAALQGLYFLVTGLWPIVHIESFLFVTGPKDSLWLVQTVGALAAAIGLALLVAAMLHETSWAGWTLGAASAAAFLTVDVVFYAAGILRVVYLADAALEVLFLVGWAYVGVTALTRTTPEGTG